MRKQRTVSLKVDFGVTLFPGKNVAILFAVKLVGGAGLALTTSGSRSQEVSCMNKKQRMTVKPSSPTVHQNSKVQEPLNEMKADNVGPATLPKFKHQWNTVKALPL